MCRSARAGETARAASDTRARSVMRMGRSGGWTESLVMEQNRSLAETDGATLAGLCWKFVKRPQPAENDRRVTNLPQICGHSALDWNRRWPKLSCFQVPAGESR